MQIVTIVFWESEIRSKSPDNFKSSKALASVPRLHLWLLFDTACCISFQVVRSDPLRTTVPCTRQSLVFALTRSHSKSG